MRQNGGGGVNMCRSHIFLFPLSSNAASFFFLLPSLWPPSPPLQPSSSSSVTTSFPLPLHRDTPFCRYVYFCLFFCFCCFGLYFAFFFFVSFCLIFWSLFSSRVLLLGRESIGDLSNSFIGRSSEDQILSSRSLFKSWH